MVPIWSTPMVRPAASHHVWNSLRPSPSSSVSVWRLLPPATPGPIFAISISESQRRSELMRRFSPGAAIKFPLIPNSCRATVPVAARQKSSSVYGAKHVADVVDQLVDLALGDDQRRRQRDNVAGGADQCPLLEGFHEGREGALAWAAGDRLELDSADEADVSDIDDMRLALQRVQ